MENNIILTSDSYKFSMAEQLPPESQKVYSYLSSRLGAKFPGTIPFSLQYILKKYLVGQVVTAEKIAEAEEMVALHFGNKAIFNKVGWTQILQKHGGMLPVRICAVPEGLLVPTNNVLLTIENTDVEFPWLTTFLETLLVQSWYGSTVATQSYFIKRIIHRYLEETGTPENIDFKLHCFGFRGSTSVESAGIGSLAHLVNFKGSDTFAANVVGRKYYHEAMASFSVPASEHSTITAWTKAGEYDAFKNMLDTFPTGIVACVSDSYDVFKACSDGWGTKLRQQILNRDGVLVIRPDSGDAVPTLLKVIDILGEKFGYSVNSKGYKVLDKHVRILQGDGVNIETIDEILHAFKENKWSADNIGFGSGGALLQKLDRDTQRFAFKCSSVVVDSIPRDVYKDPITDPGKTSKRGRLQLVKNAAGELLTVPESAGESGNENLLQNVFWDGQLLVDDSLATIRARAMESFKVYDKVPANA